MKAMKALQDVDQPFPCIDLITEAEKELTAYLSAVKEVLGPESVNMAAERWLQALDEMCFSNLATKEPYRRVTYSAVSTLCH
jgi:hypothetical protein